MTQEDKELLLKDLSARLPYHVKVKVWLEDGTTEEGTLDLEHNYADVLLDAFYYNKIKDIKPYLRPMTSMTEEEREIYQNIIIQHSVNLESWHEVDFLNKHHLDYRGLIDKDLAVAVTKENNPYEEIKL